MCEFFDKMRLIVIHVEFEFVYTEKKVYIFVFHIWSVLLSTTIKNSLQLVPSEAIILFCKNFKTHPTEHQYKCFQVTYLPLFQKKSNGLR